MLHLSASGKKLGGLQPTIAAVLHSGGVTFTFDGNDSSINSRRQTVVEGFIPPGVAASSRPGEQLAKNLRGGGGKGQLQSVGVKENCVEGVISKESKSGQLSTRDPGLITETLLPSGKSFAVTELPPRVKERESPRTGRRGTEML